MMTQKEGMNGNGGENSVRENCMENFTFKLGSTELVGIIIRQINGLKPSRYGDRKVCHVYHAQGMSSRVQS